MRRVAVIGGGPAGLAAAWSLAEAGVAVTLYEAGVVAGGLLRSDTLEGAPLDVAIQLLGSYYDETIRLADEVGASGLLARAPGRDALWRGGRAHGLSYGSVISMAGSSALPVGLKFHLASRYLPFLRRHSRELDPAEPVRAVALDRESIAAWGARELGEDFVDLLVYPQLAAYYGLTPAGTSAGFYHSLARAGLDLQLYAVRGGMSELAAAVVRALVERGVRVRTESEVVAVGGAPGRMRVEWSTGAELHDAAILAVPAPVARALMGPVDQPGGAGQPAAAARLGEWLAGVRFADEAVAALSLGCALPVDYFGLSFPEGTPPGDKLAAICVQGSKGAGLNAPGREVLVLVPAPAVMSRIVAATPREALDLLLPSVELVYPGIREQVTRARVYRFPGGRALFYPGYLEHLRHFDPTWLPPGLELAGDYLVAPTVEGAVRSGRRAAARLLRGGLG